MSIPLTAAGSVSAGSAAGAYARVAACGSPSADGGFGAVLSRAIGGAVEAGRAADTASLQAVAGQGNITEVVTAVSKAELALQGAVAVRDKVVQAYQEIMRMPI